MERVCVSILIALMMGFAGAAYDLKASMYENQWQDQSSEPCREPLNSSSELICDETLECARDTTETEATTKILSLHFSQERDIHTTKPAPPILLEELEMDKTSTYTPDDDNEDLPCSQPDFDSRPSSPDYFENSSSASAVEQSPELKKKVKDQTINVLDEVLKEIKYGQPCPQLIEILMPNELMSYDCIEHNNAYGLLQIRQEILTKDEFPGGLVRALLAQAQQKKNTMLMSLAEILDSYHLLFIFPQEFQKIKDDKGLIQYQKIVRHKKNLSKAIENLNERVDFENLTLQGNYRRIADKFINLATAKKSQLEQISKDDRFSAARELSNLEQARYELSQQKQKEITKNKKRSRKEIESHSDKENENKTQQNDNDINIAENKKRSRKEIESHSDKENENKTQQNDNDINIAHEPPRLLKKTKTINKIKGMSGM